MKVENPSSGGGIPGGSNLQIQFNSAGAFAGSGSFTWDDASRELGISGRIEIAAVANDTPLTISGYSLTGSSALPILDLLGTWNSTGTPSAIRLNVTNTASNSASKLLDLQIGGTTLASVGVAGHFNSGVTGSSGALSECAYQFNSQGGLGYGASYMFANGGGVLLWSLRSDAGFVLANNIRLGFSADASFGGTVFLERDADNVLAQKNAANAQTSRISGNTTGSHFLSLAHNGTNAILSVNGGGTLHLSSLPTANPGPGILWNNSGTPAIGT